MGIRSIGLLICKLNSITMNKADLITKIAADAGITKVQAEKALSSITNSVTTTLKKGESVSLIGFGTFTVGQRAARSGRNPNTGAVIKIKATKVPKFRPGKSLREAVASAKTKK